MPGRMLWLISEESWFNFHDHLLAKTGLFMKWSLNLFSVSSSYLSVF